MSCRGSVGEGEVSARSRGGGGSRWVRGDCYRSRSSTNRDTEGVGSTGGGIGNCAHRRLDRWCCWGRCSGGDGSGEGTSRSAGCSRVPGRGNWKKFLIRESVFVILNVDGGHGSCASFGSLRSCWNSGFCKGARFWCSAGLCGGARFVLCGLLFIGRSLLPKNVFDCENSRLPNDSHILYRAYSTSVWRPALPTPLI